MPSLVQREKRWRRQANNVQGLPMGGPEVAKLCGLPSGTRWRVHLHGEASIADGDVGGHGIFHGPSRRPSKDGNLNHQPPPIMVLAAPLVGNERNESGPLMERLRRRPVHQRAARPHSGFSQRRHPEQRSITRQHAGRGSVQAEPS